MILKLVIAAGLILLTLFGMVRVHRYLKGEGASLYESRRKREESQAGPNDLEQFIESYRREKANGGGTATPGATAATVMPTATAPAARRAFLAGPGKLLYLVLKAGLPDHHVFANCRLGDLLEPPPHGGADTRVDFVVCRNDLQPLAVVELSMAGTSDPSRRNVAQTLAAAGIRYLRVQPPALPKPADVRALIYPAGADGRASLRQSQPPGESLPLRT
jgi:hypothetical protein